MDYSYITEEDIWTRTAAYKTPEWEQEHKIYDALRFYFAKLPAYSLAKASEYSDLYCVSIGQFEMRITDNGFYFKSVHSTVDTDHVGFALEELSKHDTTHCLSLRVIMQHSDPSSSPWLAQKLSGEQRVKFGRELWEQAVPVNETKEDWKGDLTCAMQLPGHTEVPAELVNAWKRIEDAYTNDKNVLIEDQIEEYEGSMTGGAFITFNVKGSDLPDLLAQLQALSDACSQLGGGWTTEGYLYSDFSVLSFDTDEEGKVTAKYIAL